MQVWKVMPLNFANNAYGVVNLTDFKLVSELPPRKFKLRNVPHFQLEACEER